MKATELMIGDWVLMRGTPVQVRAIGFNTIRYSDMLITEPLDNIEPIPLTPEILEKNGFEPVGFHRVWSNEEIKGRIEVDCVRDVSLEFWYVKYNNFPNKGRVRAWYVHELQHTLTNAEINKRIVL